MLSSTAASRASARGSDVGFGRGCFKVFLRLWPPMEAIKPQPAPDVTAEPDARSCEPAAPASITTPTCGPVGPGGRVIPPNQRSVDQAQNRQIAEMLDSFGEGFIAFDFEWRVTHCN